MLLSCDQLTICQPISAELVLVLLQARCHFCYLTNNSGNEICWM